MITDFTIFGERCSGTHFVEQLILSIFNVNVTYKYGWKHFYGFNSLGNSDNTLFVGVVRDPAKWINSLYRTPHHVCKECTTSIPNFLNKEFSADPNTWNCRLYYGPHYKFFGQDRHIYTKQKYKNIFEMRHVKLRFLLDDVPKKVKHYILIRYEDLLSDFEKTMTQLKDAGLTVNTSIQFPVNIDEYLVGNSVEKAYPKFTPNVKTDIISRERIINHPNFKRGYEKRLKYI